MTGTKSKISGAKWIYDRRVQILAAYVADAELAMAEAGKNPNLLPFEPMPDLPTLVRTACGYAALGLVDPAEVHDAVLEVAKAKQEYLNLLISSDDDESEE